MKTILNSILAITLVVGGVSCAAGPNAQTGAVAGGLLGAGAGGIIGHQSGRGLEGAAVGAGLGALGGGLIGNAQDQRNARYYGPPPRQYRRPAPSYYGY